ncbi:phage integrase SAM-like domain-containing protein [Elizabethkingia occulta]|uniref:Integrase n=1 Tax=Elizabethkingia occulta TaxID=1867263 RepID=A0A1T3MN52_9FLAO|nr:phage integrase SAM-like domain-containing protein [Elizabethkingia occulta]OPB96431.1 integrase [Elizabethkingia occulta]OPC66025.1 integrase [Elizabethkingia occulta]
MEFNFQLTNTGLVKNINLTITTFNNQFFKLRTPFSICKEEWNHDKSRPKNIYIKKYKELNYKLDFLKIELSKYLNERIQNKKSFSKYSISKIVLNICSENHTHYPENSLLYFMLIYIQNKKVSISHSTYKRYMVFFNLIRKFEGFIIKQQSIEDINPEFINRFIIYGRNEAYSESTILRTLNFVKTILNFVEKKGIKTAVRELELKQKKVSKEVLFLTEQEIKKIKQTTLPDALIPARNWLIISCYSGQRFSDFMAFSKEKITKIEDIICIKFIQQKTKKEILLPLHPAIINILQQNGNCFPRHMNIGDYNRDIRLIAKYAGINTILNVKKRIGFRTKQLFLEKWQAISSHIGRRSFATNFYGKIPTPLLMGATGHSSEQIFLQYINHMDKERAVSLASYFNKHAIIH